MRSATELTPISLHVSLRHPILPDLRELSPLLESERLSQAPRARDCWALSAAN